MKKILFFFIALFAIVIVGAINFHLNVEQEALSVNLKNNVEALAQTEGSGSVRCYYAGTVSCPNDASLKVKYVVSRTQD